VKPTDVMNQNLRAWNEVAPRHAELNFDTVRRQLTTHNAYYLDSALRAHLLGLDLPDKTIVQFNCNNGRELISAMQLGARQGYGFDFSGEFIEQASRLNDEVNLKIEFVETNIYDIPAGYDGVGDVLLATSGALCWMPDLIRYFETAYRVLKPGGTLVVYETHPFLEMFKLDRDRKPGEELRLHYPYFMSTPVASHSGLDYYSNEIYGQEVVYWYHHTLSGILQSIIDAGFTVRRFTEFEHDIDSGYASVRACQPRPPMCYLIDAKK
jgi:SAM-dependent methyltransferase